LTGTSVVIAAFNTPDQTVVSGTAVEVARVVARAEQMGWPCVRLATSHAFHSVLVAAARAPLASHLEVEEFIPVRNAVFSTVSGLPLAPEDDLRELLCRQVTSPVRFLEAVTQAVDQCDLWIEVGPGHVLCGLLGHYAAVARRRLGRRLPAGDALVPPALALDAGGPSLRGLLTAVGTVFALGGAVRYEALFEDRWRKPFQLPWSPRFFANPCELAPLHEPPGEGAGPTTCRPGLLTRRGRFKVTEQVCKEPATPAEPTLTPALSYPMGEGGGKAGEDTMAADTLPLVCELVSARAELPPEAIHDDSRLLADLHLNSITVGQLVAEAARRLGLPPLAGLNEFANATVGAVARALAELKRSRGVTPDPVEPTHPAGVDTWLRAFGVEWVPTDRPGPTAHLPEVAWEVLALPDHPWAGTLAAGLKAPNQEPGTVTRSLAGNGRHRKLGVVVCLPAGPPAAQVPLLLDAARKVLARRDAARFVLVQSGAGASGFARTLFLESRQIAVTVLTIPTEAPQATDWIAAEAVVAHGFREARYDATGGRFEPRLRLVELPEAAPNAPLTAKDVLLVTGGGKGIAAECALALARRTGVRLLLLGRSRAEADLELAANLARLSEAGVAWNYFSADITDAPAVRAAVAATEREWGPVTAILHGAGANVPQLIGTLDENAFDRTLQPKVRGFENVLDAVDPEQLRLVLTFSSIIARCGLPGEADYAMANEWLTRLTEEFQQQHPRCRCLALEWSVWSGVGMGERLGRIETLLAQGITPITPDQGVEILCRLAAAPAPATALIVSGRFGELPTLPWERPDLPFRRFLERPLVNYPGIELVVEVTVSADTDPYVQDHAYRGERLFPAVMGLEAMAQVAMAVVGAVTPPRFERVEWLRPLVVPRTGSTKFRVAALVRRPDEVEVVLRCEDTGFQTDHFRGVCRFAVECGAVGQGRARQLNDDGPLRAAEPASVPPDVEVSQDLYASLLFHTGRFQRVAAYQELRAKGCDAVVTDADTGAWFGAYLPQELVLGDAGARDAGIHAIQACIPHLRLLPVGVEQIERAWPSSHGPPVRSPGFSPSQATPPAKAGTTNHRLTVAEQVQTVQDTSPGPPETGKPVSVPELTIKRPVRVTATERAHAGDEFTYDVEYFDAQGRVVETWHGLRLRVVEPLPLPGAWAASLFGNYVERRCAEWFAGLNVLVEADLPGARREALRAGRPVPRATDPWGGVGRRPDGRPGLAGLPGTLRSGDGSAGVSVAYAGSVRLSVVGPEPLGCDFELVRMRAPQTWLDLLGSAQQPLASLLAREGPEPFDVAATRLWVARECIKKAGLPVTTPLLLEAVAPDGWVLLRAGAQLLATCHTRLRRAGGPVVLGILAMARAPKPLDALTTGVRSSARIATLT
jgi:enediyne polyketide synthase